MKEMLSRSRTGAPSKLFLHDRGLSTVIQIGRDASGNLLPPKTMRQMWRLRKWQIRSNVHSYKNLIRAMTELDRLSDKMAIPQSVEEKAALIYRKALDKRLVRGRSVEGIAAASLYLACRITKTLRNFREISEASLVSEKDLGRYYRLLLRELDIRIPICDPKTYLSKIAEKTNISSQTQALALKIRREAEKKVVTAGKNPRGIAATALYLACRMRGECITQKELAEATDLTQVTIRKRKKEIVEKLGLNI